MLPLLDESLDLGTVVPVRSSGDVIVRHYRHGEFTTRRELDRLALVTTNFETIVESARRTLQAEYVENRGPRPAWGWEWARPEPIANDNDNDNDIGIGIGISISISISIDRTVSDRLWALVGTQRHLVQPTPRIPGLAFLGQPLAVHHSTRSPYLRCAMSLAEARAELTRATQRAEDLGELHVLNGADGDLVAPLPMEVEAGTPLRLVTTRPILRTGPPRRTPTGPTSGGAIAA
jgi:hypothetical protein